MVRGTTARYKFKLPYPKSELAWATIKFWQPNNPDPLSTITRRLESCVELDEYILCATLTAEETARFCDKYKAKLQLRAQHYNSGTVFGSKPIIFTVYPMSDKIIEDDFILPPETEGNIVILDGEDIDNSEETILIDGEDIINTEGGGD